MRQNREMGRVVVVIAIPSYSIIYWEGTRLDDLGGLFGSMDTEIFADKTPVDRGIFEDWGTITGKMSNLTLDECFDYMVQFVKKQNEWLDLGSLVGRLQLNSNQEWEEFQ